MLLAVVIAFLSGLFIGAFIGVVSISLGVMAKRNVENMPETPINLRRDAVPMTINS